MNITLVDPKGIKRSIPIDQAQAALEAGAKYSSLADKNMAIEYGKKQSSEGSWLDKAKVQASGIANAASEIPQGYKEGLQKAYAGLTGGEFKASEPSQEYGSGLGRGIGEMLGQGTVAAPAAIAGGLIGGPVGAYLGGSLGAAATTPGGLPERGIAAAETLAVPVGGKLIGGAAKQITKLPKQFKSLFTKAEPEKALDLALARHDSLNETASDLFNWSRGQMKERGFSPKPSTEVMGKVERFLADTPDDEILFEKAKSGDPDAVHKLQSWLWKKGNKAANSEDDIVSNRGREMLSLRHQLNDSVQSQASQAGHNDIVHAYKQGQKLYKELKDTYYKYKKIANVFDPELRKIPKDVTSHFNENSTPMKNFFKSHPELEEEVSKSADRVKAIKDLQKNTSLIGTGGGLYYLGTKMSDFL